MAGDRLGARVARVLARTVRTKVATARAPAPFVSFTFDDVHASAATRGAEILERHEARGTFYIAGALIGTVAPERTAASHAQCAALHARGHELACHTFSHVHVAKAGREGLAEDLHRNADTLASLGAARPPKNFAYPFNATSLAVKQRLERRFATCRGGIPGVNAGRVDLGFLRAVELHDDGLDIEGVRQWIGRAKRETGWLVFFTHGVQDAPEPWRCTPALLDAAVATARDAGCAVGTIADAVERLGFAA